jgi:hypothetical protein
VTSYYIYYRVEAGRLPGLRAEVERVLGAVERATGVRGRWMRRRDKPDTYMEVYEDVRDEAAFEAMLARETAGLGLERHVERFLCA